MSVKPRPAIDRVLDRITVTPFGCWEFQGALSQGYGVVGNGGRGTGTSLTHRVTYASLVGIVPDGLDLDHLCRNRACCNPEHLEPVERIENVRRGLRGPGYGAAITHCKRGHEFTPWNTARSSGTNQRICRACHRAKGYLNARRRLRGVGYSEADVKRLSDQHYRTNQSTKEVTP